MHHHGHTQRDMRHASFANSTVGWSNTSQWMSSAAPNIPNQAVTTVIWYTCPFITGGAVAQLGAFFASPAPPHSMPFSTLTKYQLTITH
mmetsp:Transcript_36109/g.80354  ORF Transcript_36109/g.80354 Transcript_36109/m.80354 type:complete len:89 (+) Transcript_36109:978-1244(+)